MSGITFESLSDKEYSLDLIAENLLRMLQYELEAGIAEFVLLLVASAGCSARLESVDVDNLESVAENVEEQCIENAHPASFPASVNKPFKRRLGVLLERISAELRDSKDTNTCGLVAVVITSFMRCRLQSLRFTATLFAVHSRELASEIDDELELRTADPMVAVRKLALTCCESPKMLAAALQDRIAGVRVAALQQLAQLPSISTATANRCVEMALRDVDVQVRRSALRTLLAHEHSSEQLSNVFYDNDEMSRVLAAQLLLPKPTQQAVHSFVEDQLENTLANLEGRRAIATAMARARSGQSSTYSSVVAKILSSVRSRKTLTPEQHSVLLDILACICQQLPTSVLSSQVFSLLPKVIDCAKYNDALVASALKAVAACDLIAIGASSQQQMTIVTNLRDYAVDFFTSRTDTDVLRSAGEVLAKLPESLRLDLRSTVYKPLRASLAASLGPRRRKPDETAILRLMMLSPSVDTGDLLRLPLASLAESGNLLVLNLLRAIGMCSISSEVVTKVVELLSGLKTKPVDDILRVCIAAKMHGLDVPFPLDVNEYPASSPTVWQAAVTSEVV